VSARHLAYTKSKLCAIQRLDSILSPFDSSASTRKFRNLHTPGVWWEKRIVNDNILEQNKHDALVAPESKEESGEDEGWHQHLADVDLPLDHAVAILTPDDRFAWLPPPWRCCSVSPCRGMYDQRFRIRK
jgi:hypothetical protein